MRARRIAAPVLGAVLGAAFPAAAKDVCVTQGTQTLVFEKVKSLKKPGTIVPLSGVYLDAGDAGPITDRDILIQMVVDPATFAGNGTYQTAGGGLTSDSWATASCKDVVYP